MLDKYWRQLLMSAALFSYRLCTVLQVVKYELGRQRGALGASVFSYNDAYEALQPALRKWRAASCAKQLPALPYIVSADISRAFDAVDAGVVLDLIAPLLQSPEYLVLRYVEVRPGPPRRNGSLAQEVWLEMFCSSL